MGKPPNFMEPGSSRKTFILPARLCSTITEHDDVNLNCPENHYIRAPQTDNPVLL